MVRSLFVLMLVSLLPDVLLHAQEAEQRESVTLNQRDDGYRGIWYMNQPSGDEYVYKYSGGLGTYCAKHRPFAVYCPEVDKTFFCYGGARKDNDRQLLHMVSYFDHQTKTVPRPMVLLDKQTDDAHDNPVISVDDEGYLWIFSTSHGRSRPSYIHRSKQPYSIEEFEQIHATMEQDDKSEPITNFSYMQTWHVPERGFICFYTRYSDPAARTSFCMTSADGVHWNPRVRLAAIDQGHYQISAVGRKLAAAAFNYHPQGKGLNWRTNLYYLQTPDFGESWQTAGGKAIKLPLTEAKNDALIHDYQNEGLNVYLKDIVFDAENRPIILFITSRGYESGPKNDPRTWTTARYNGKSWDIRPAFTSDNNYDMGSLWIGKDGSWRIIAPALSGPQPYNPGGEVGMWLSRDQGENWQQVKQLTADSDMNHTYVRRPVNAHPDFYALWADGHGRKPSQSRLYFANQAGEVFMLPRKMDGETATGEQLKDVPPK